MDLSLSEEQLALRDLVDDILGEDAAPEKLSDALKTDLGYAAEVQDALVEAGLTAIGLGDDEDATLIELGIVFTQLGYHAYSGPFEASALAALTAARLLGEHGAGVVELVQGGGIATLAEFPSAAEDGGRFTGLANGVECAAAAQAVVLAVPVAGGQALWVVEPGAPGVTITAQTMMDGTRAGAVVLEGAELGAPLVTVAARQWREHVHVLRMLRAADLVGVIRRVQEMTVAHVAQREQFGKPIGQFQAVQHHLANMATDQEAGRNLVFHGLWRYAEGEDFERQAAEAAWFVADAAVRATQQANQMHGGIGFMKEYHLHHFHNRSATQRGRMGAEHRRLADLGDVVVEAMERDFQNEFMDWPVR